MTIKTKYNIGDEVWVEFFMEPTHMVVKSIEFRKNENTESICYLVVNVIDHRERYNAKESELFSTKEELIKSL